MASDTVKVRHIGTHAKRCDTMSGEGTEWNGYGDVKTVSRKAWENHLSRYKDLWELVADEPAAAPQPPAEAEKAADEPAPPVAAPAPAKKRFGR